MHQYPRFFYFYFFFILRTRDLYLLSCVVCLPFSLSMLINGDPMDFFQPQRGLCQGNN